MTRQFTDKDLRNLTPEQALEIFRQGEDAVAWALLKLAALAQGKPKRDPSTPSGQVPPYEKPNGKKKKKRKRKRGRKAGHEGARRKTPPDINKHEEHKLEACPECGGAVSAPYDARTRVIEDIEKSTVVVTEHTIHSHYCAACKKRVEPKVTDALPKAAIGNRALVLSSWLHYGQGQTISQIVSVLDSLFHFPVSGGGLSSQWQRLADILEPWYELIAEEARDGAVLHADETGWRVSGRTHWLWCFATPDLTYYAIEASRGSVVAQQFLAECFEGVLVTDFYAAYNKVTASGRQMCLAHLLRELKKVSDTNQSKEWQAFEKTLKRLLKDAIRLSRRCDREAEDYKRKVNRIHLRLDDFCAEEYEDADCKRLAKRLRKHRYSLFTFLDEADVPFDNNRAEREIRPAVIIRKNSLHNTSENGARTQAILMSIYRTLKLRAHDPLETIGDAIALFIATGTLPELPRPPDGKS
jgi:transposase